MRKIVPQTSADSTIDATMKPRIEGKFLQVRGSKLSIRGVTYGTFRRGEDGVDYDAKTVRRDFAQIAANGFNAIRTYTVPPRWLLDVAAQYGIYVMVGLAWEQHIAFLDEKKLIKRIEQTVRQGVQNCAGHPAVLCYTIGNEIPASIVRWHGRRRIERFLRELHAVAKREDPEGLFTYVNYPSTEYLDLPFMDLVCCNVYLESQERLEAYLARLQNIAGDRPLILGEVGLDSRRNGEEVQARVLEWQVGSAFGAGCAGVFIFAWTDEWHRGGFDIEDWNFGLTRWDRKPKPALAAVRRVLDQIPFPAQKQWPHISVIVCTYNGSRTIRDCCDGLKALDYPNFEVIVVNDGSTDGTDRIVREYGFRVITTENRGLSSARNTGLHAAKGEIVAYIDDDARPDPHWLNYLAFTFTTTSHVGVGGPNIAPPGDGIIADSVANAPGGPIHVLLSDAEAEHIPGCNMAFRRSALLSVGGFDPTFRVAGDDVDICWRLQEQGWTLGFHPGAMVMHHRRNSIRAYWRQQKGYGKAEALLEKKWPQKYNGAGHPTWAGRLYSKGLSRYLLARRGRVYQGIWGAAPFQSLEETPPTFLDFLLVMPEWYLMLGILLAASVSAPIWKPLVVSWPLLGLGITATVVHAILNALHCPVTGPTRSSLDLLKFRSATALLHLIQPLARLLGRVRHGLTPWRKRAQFSSPVLWPSASAFWSGRWQALSDRLRLIENQVGKRGLSVSRGGPYDHWDLAAFSGLLGGARALCAVEEHGTGKQLVRMRTWPVVSRFAAFLVLLFPALSVAAAWDRATAGSIVMGLAAAVIFVRLLRECGAAGAALHESLQLHESVNGETENIQVTEHPITAMHPLKPNTLYESADPIGKAAQSSE